MNKALKKELLYILVATLFLTKKSFSQDAKTVVYQNPKFEQLLNEKRKINSSITINDRYKIQIYNGDSESTKKTLTDFKKENETDATIIFSTPQYKIWVGNYKTRIEAEKQLQAFKKKYPNAFLIRPNK